MYVAPRPEIEDDPLFAVRLASAAVIGMTLAALFQSTLPMLIPAIIVGLMAGMRKAFDPKKAFGGPMAMIVMVAGAAWLMDLARPMPLVMVAVFGMLCLLGYLLILRTGNPIGMLILVAAVLMAIMRMHSFEMMLAMRDGFVEASLCALVAIPILYMIFPPATSQMMVEDYTPAPGGYHGRRAFIRATVLMFVSMWLFLVLETGDMIMAVAAIFVLCFPTRERLWAEALERTVATIAGGSAALAILWVFTFAAHLPVLLILLFLGGSYFASRMMNGYFPPMVYQFAFSTMIALVAGGLSTQQPVDGTMLRVSLTIVGATAAAFLTAFLERVFVPDDAAGT